MGNCCNDKRWVISVGMLGRGVGQNDGLGGFSLEWKIGKMSWRCGREEIEP